MRGLTVSEYWSGFRNGSQMGLGTGDKRMRVGSGEYATGDVTVAQRSLLEQSTVTQTSTLPSSDGDNRESHSSVDDTIIMSSHDN